MIDFSKMTVSYQVFSQMDMEYAEAFNMIDNDKDKHPISYWVEELDEEKSELYEMCCMIGDDDPLETLLSDINKEIKEYCIEHSDEYALTEDSLLKDLDWIKKGLFFVESYIKGPDTSVEEEMDHSVNYFKKALSEKNYEVADAVEHRIIFELGIRYMGSMTDKITREAGVEEEYTKWKSENRG